MTTQIALKANIHDLIARRNAALAKASEAAAALAEAMTEADGACVGEGAGRASYELREAFKAQIAYSFKSFDAEKIRIAVDRSMWRSFVVNTPLWSLMDTKARKEFDASLAGVPPEANAENLHATMSKYYGDADAIFRRSLIETFANLSSDYRSNDVFKLDAKIVLTGIQSQTGGFNHYAEDRIRDLDRVFWVLDGEEYPTDYNASLVGILRQAMNEAGSLFKSGAGVVETAYFRVRFFKNGNAHVFFLCPELVDKANRLIAEHYGVTLPDAKKAAPVSPVREGMDENFFETPDDVADQMVELANIHDGHEVLEPSAGNGALMKAIYRAVPEMSWERITGYEVNQDRATKSGAACLDFMSVYATARFDRIVMNPPFSGHRWAKHLIHAWNMLKPGGRLVALLPNAAPPGSLSKHMAHIDQQKLGTVPVPAGAFKAAGTMIATRIVVYEKPIF